MRRKTMNLAALRHGLSTDHASELANNLYIALEEVAIDNSNRDTLAEVAREMIVHRIRYFGLHVRDVDVLTSSLVEAWEKDR